MPNEFISAKAAFLMDADTGAILYQKNPDLRLPPGQHHQSHDRDYRFRK